MAEHSPTPWELRGQDDFLFVVDANGEIVLELYAEDTEQAASYLSNMRYVVECVNWVHCTADNSPNGSANVRNAEGD